jgi:hypothetical protein
MKTLYLWAATVLLCCIPPAVAQTSVFTYQGSLGSNAAPTSGLFDFQFTLYDSAASTNRVGGPVTNAPLAVSNGLFTASLDFGAGTFDGSERWLQMGVRAFGDTNAYVILSPRQLLTATPYALRAANYSGPVAAAALTGTIADSQLSTNVALVNSNVTFSGSVTAGQFLGDGGGLTNVPATNPDYTPTGGGTSTPNHSYIATNDATAAVVVLPPSGSLQPGDTIRVTGAGLAGYYIQQNAGQTIELRQLDDTFGLVWGTNGSTNFNYKAVAVSADAKNMVAVAYNAGGGGYFGGMFNSTNYGVTWVDRGMNLNWSSVASSGDGKKMVGCVNGGQIYTSTNSGGIWTARDSARSWSSVASSFDGVKLIATTDGASGQVFTSEDSGVTWTSRLTLSGMWSSCACSATGSNVVASSSILTNLATSTNGGLTWSQSTVSNAFPIPVLALSADGTWLIAGPRISPDFGTTWIGATGPAKGFASCSADGSRIFKAINSGTPGRGEVDMSLDSGFTWSICPLPQGNFNGVACSADGSTVVAVAEGGHPIYICRSRTTPGTTGYLFGGRFSSIELQYLGNGVFMPISHIGTFRWK